MITDCHGPPCKLKKKTRVGIVQAFKPNKDIRKLKTSVYANILGLPLPFIGVDNTDACDKIYTSDGKKASCPLKKDVKYIYKNEFPILDFYPTVKCFFYSNYKCLKYFLPYFYM